MTSLAEIRKKLQEQETRSAGFVRDNSIYPFWTTPIGKETRTRFVPDGDKDNPFFWIERQMIRLPFPGIKNSLDSKPVTIKVPCMEMWKGSICPVLSEIRPWWKDSNLESLAKKYWVKKDYLLHGFVRDGTAEDKDPPENPIRRFVVNKQIYPNITSVIKDPEVEEMPTDYNRGLDFIFKSTANGKWASFSTSSWARKESALTSLERAAIDNYGLPSLKSYLPKKPTDQEVVLIKEMFEASVDNQMYDLERWGSYINPVRNNNNEEPSTPTAKSHKSDQKESEYEGSQNYSDPEEEEEDDVPFTPASTPVSGEKKSPRAEELLAMIRARKTS